MPNPSTNGKVDFARKLQEWIMTKAPELKKHGFNPDVMLKRLEDAIQATVTSAQLHETLKAQVREQTRAVQATDNAMRTLTTSYLDMMSGAYGKHSETSRQLQRLRTRVDRIPED